jgi:hypothetical protein
MCSLLSLQSVRGAGRATGYGLEGPGCETRWQHEIFSFVYPSRTILGPTQTPLQWVPGRFPRNNAAGEGGCGVDHPSQSSADLYLASVPAWHVMGKPLPYSLHYWHWSKLSLRIWDQSADILLLCTHNSNNNWQCNYFQFPFSCELRCIRTNAPICGRLTVLALILALGLRLAIALRSVDTSLVRRHVDPACTENKIRHL